MGKVIDLCGQKFGRLIVVRRAENNKYKRAQWLCRCCCGIDIVINSDSLRRGHTKSCGCFNKEAVIQRNIQRTIHGHAAKNTKTYVVWCNMISRCYSSNAINYKYYGGRGIRVCEEWCKFENFLQDMGERIGNMTLDRIDNNSNYNKENCRWSTIKEQNTNKRNNINITLCGITKCLKDWCKFYNMFYGTVLYRVHHGWTAEEALELIPRKKKGK